MDLATYLIGATIVAFIVGAGFALAWSFATGQWRDLDAQARIPLDEDDDVSARSTRTEVSV